MRISIKIIFSVLSICSVLGSTNIVGTNTAKPKSIFVIADATGIVTEYNAENFIVKQTLQIPKDLYFSKTESNIRSERLRVSGSGCILYYDDETHFDREIVVRRLWYWDGKKEQRAEISIILNQFPTKDRCFVSDDISPPILDAEEEKFYWVKNHVVGFREEMNGDDYPEYYITLDVELYMIYFREDKLVEKLISKIHFNECKCETGACEETCPIGIIIAPKGGVKNFIEVEHLVQGQLESRIEGYTYFEKRDNNWIKTNADKKFEKPFAEVHYDGGCCGWVNESSDKLLVIDGKKQKIIYDEWERFNNRNYDISFNPTNAELSPDLRKIAYTIAPDQYAMYDYKNEGTFRLSSDGKENLHELKRIKTVLSDLPMVEVLSIDEETEKILVMKNTEFVGWIDNNRLLLLKDDKIGTFDISTRRFIESSISIKSIEHVFLR